MDHLSAEERACLMFLEETIESLEAEDSSGVSIDKQGQPSHSRTNKMARPRSISQVNPADPSVHEDPNRVLGKDHKPNKLLVPTPLILANGNAKLLKKTDFSTTEHKPAVLVNAPKPPALNPHPTSANGTAVSSPNPEKHKANAYLSSELTELPPSFIPEPPVKPDPSGATAKEYPSNIHVRPRSDPKHTPVSSDLPMELLPPPSDFMDEPVLLPPVHALSAVESQPHSPTYTSQLQSESMPIAPPPGFDGEVEENKPTVPMSTSPGGHLSPNELAKLRKKASLKKTPEKVPVVQVRPGHNVIDQAHSPTFGPDIGSVPLVEYGEPKNPPTVAPKPKKLPTSIVLKPHKDAAPGHTLVAPGDRLMINQQKVHLEALKKLGLLKNDETDSGHCYSPPHKASSPNTHASVVLPSAEPTAESGLGLSEHHTAFEAPAKTEFSFSSLHPEKTEHLLITRTPSSKSREVKSASLERSVTGLKSLTIENPSHSTGRAESPEDMRNSRSQPVAVVNWKDVSTDEIPSESNREPELRKSLYVPAPSPPQPKAEPQKSLRSHGISVVISPQSQDDEDRKQALRRLGLFKE